ncbi:hypothetical protein [Nannocystis punicea]|uniref:Uncharacterized protein n=1 Tax=Nannocystis punicea TaxID=2995304 RepID=A0ABY7GSZ1_9BACT|nr:hypothetical protein [Nannocystis poenicansa]WAS90047.1 hypothetical protein O0S08_27960 [Nannocystis poenicansa]
MSRPRLSLHPDHRTQLSAFFPDTFASLADYAELVDAADDGDLAAACAVAGELAGVVHSSDVDCDYYPCALLGPDPTGDEFFAALGVARDARAKVSGWDNPRLEVVRAGAGEGDRPALALITRLNEGELLRIGDYIVEDDQQALARALDRLAALGPVVGVQLCTDDGASKVVLTLARRAPGVHVGVLTVRVET